ncbi:GTP-binding protein [Chiua virens]|nr:GTP-binding protein [Chiua virens]
MKMTTRFPFFRSKTPKDGSGEALGEPPGDIPAGSTTMEIDGIREKFGRFRILVIGRANAGKTTILKQICNSTEDPEIYDRNGNRVDQAEIKGTKDRGKHNIENEVVFRSNPNFVFHDSQGFEAGSKEEFEKMKDFVSERAKTSFLKKRIHAIWYCIPMDQYHRAVLASEEKFFDECNTGNVPVILVLTKCDALLLQGLAALTPEEKELPREERLVRGHQNAESMLKKNTVWERVQSMKYPPKANVELRDLDKSDKGSKLLIERTVKALDEETLQMLFVTAQHTNGMVCTEYAIER